MTYQLTLGECLSTAEDFIDVAAQLRVKAPTNSNRIRGGGRGGGEGGGRGRGRGGGGRGRRG